jgi:hypothetical protein
MRDRPIDPTPDFASLHPGYGLPVARMQRSGMRDRPIDPTPDFASLHPGYGQPPDKLNVSGAAVFDPPGRKS